MTTPTSKKLATIGVAAFALVLGGLTQPSADEKTDPAKCDNGTLKGSYGFTLTGWRIPTPDTNVRSARAGVGRIVFDGRGNISGSETKSHDGLIIPLTFTGTYQVLTDCTGTAHVVTSDPGEAQRNLNFTIVELGEQVMAIQTDQGRAVTVIVTKQRAK
jgi:hypothetical protein